MKEHILKKLHNIALEIEQGAINKSSANGFAGLDWERFLTKEESMVLSFLARLKCGTKGVCASEE
jgi:hypothetical protein